MKKMIISAAVASLPAIVMAQSAINAYQMSQSDLRGTARFMSMGGAFGALGGDLSALNQNPGGIGVYRGSDVGVTVDFNITSAETNTPAGVFKDNKTYVYCNNFGYIGTVNLDSDVMPTFSWGASFSRVASFDRMYSGSFSSLSTSMSNYIANFSNGYSPATLYEPGKGEDGYGYNPFQDSDADWLSILAYNSYMINPIGDSDEYNGLFKNGTTGNAQFSVRERGYIDEYAINFGGNVANTLYWGVGFGITDIKFTQEAFYDEELTNARIPNEHADGTANGDAYNALSNYSNVTGTGFNMKFGVILKPINEFRIGLAVHTPTWYSLSQTYDANVDYSYAPAESSGETWFYPASNYYTDVAYSDWKMKSPWRLIASAAGVIGGRFIISGDYEYTAYNSMTISRRSAWNSFETIDNVTGDIKNYFKAANTVRLGAELRVTPQFSLRAGYSYTTSNVQDGIAHNRDYVFTSVTNPAYTLDNSTQYVTCGLGYRFSGFYVDAAYVHKNRKSTYHAFSSFSEGDWQVAPQADMVYKNNNIVLTLGYKF